MDKQFANFTWESRWNQSEAVVYLEESGEDIFMVNCMGSLTFKRDDAKFIANHFRRTAELLEGLGND